MDFLWVLDLKCEEDAERLDALLAAVDVVAEEQVVRLRRRACVVQEPQEVVVLPVDVRSHCQRRAELEEHGLLPDQRQGLIDKPLNLLELQVYQRADRLILD